VVYTDKLGEEQWELFAAEATQGSIFDEDLINPAENKPKMDETTKIDKAIWEEYPDIFENPTAFHPVDHT
jgi:hypothetical protein